MDERALTYPSLAGGLKLIESVVINPPKKQSIYYSEQEVFLLITLKSPIDEGLYDVFVELLETFIMALFLIVDTDTYEGILEFAINDKKGVLSLIVYHPAGWRFHQYNELEKILLKKARYYKWKVFSYKDPVFVDHDTTLYTLDPVRA